VDIFASIWDGSVAETPDEDDLEEFNFPEING